MTSTVSVSSPAPVDLVSSWVAAFNERDLDGMLDCLDRNVDFRPLKLTGLDRSYRGHDRVRRWFEQIGQLGYDYRLDVDSLSSDDEGSVVIVAGSLRLGPAALAPFSAIHTTADGQILSAHYYLSELDLIDRLGLVA
jgi:ketosteroid isomerase-like protein